MYDLCVHRIYSSVYTRTRNRVCSVHVCITSIYIYIYLNVLSGSCVDNNNNSDDRIEPTDTFQVTHDKFAHGIALSTVSVFMISMHSHSQTYTIITNNNNKRNVCWIYFFFLPVFFLLTVHHRPTETRLHGVVCVCGYASECTVCCDIYDKLLKRFVAILKFSAFRTAYVLLIAVGHWARILTTNNTMLIEQKTRISIRAFCIWKGWPHQAQAINKQCNCH